MKMMPLEDFLNEGWLAEINRLILHPAGLAMTFSLHEDGTVGFFGTQDARDDDEGFVFKWDDGPPEKARKKADFVARAMESKRKAREAKLGFHIQPVTRPEDQDAHEERDSGAIGTGSCPLREAAQSLCEDSEPPGRGHSPRLSGS
jgi:hypothetical protein